MVLCSKCSKPQEALTVDGLCSVCNEARKGESKGSKTSWGNERIARVYCEAWGEYLAYDALSERFWRYVNQHGRKPKANDFKGCSWRLYPIKKIDADIVKFCDNVEKYGHLTANKIRDISKLCQYYCQQWEHGIKDKYISFSDCLIDPDTLERSEHHPERISTINLDVAFDDLPNAKSPMFDKYMDDVCRDENGKPIPEMSEQVYQMIGYLLSNRNFHKAFFLAGPGGNGKGVLIQILTELLTAERVSSLKIADMEGFNLGGMIGMKANIVGEDESEGMSGDTWKTIVSGELLQIREIYTESRSIRFNVKCVACCNFVPTFKNYSGEAMRRRIVPINFDAKIDKTKIIDDLGGKIVDAGELPAIVWRGLQALQRLKENNFQFIINGAGEETLNNMENASSNVASYVKLWKRDDGGKVSFKQLYDHYCSWVDENKHKPMSSTKFGLKVKEYLGRSKSMRIDGKIVLGYEASLVVLPQEPQPELPNF